MMTKRFFLSALVVAAVGTTGQRANAVDYDLRAATTTITMSDGRVVTMWGFGLVGDPSVSVPGPVLVVPPGDSTLTIRLTNQLPENVSIIIPGIPTPLTPVWSDGTSGPRANLQQRAVSFTHVTPPGQTVTYQWNGVEPGTYLYQSGTHAAKQVPMGLYGAVEHDDATPQSVYGVAYDAALVLVYSEVDPTLNDAVRDGAYGTPAYPTSIGYRPRYSLINGQQASNPSALARNIHDRLLLRVVNAGLRTVVPTLTAGSMLLLAEDGHAAPFARDSYAMLLPAGKTRDALLVFTGATSTVLFDRRGSAQLARITATPAPGAPVAVADAYATTEDVVLDTAVAMLPSVLGNDTGTGLSAVLDSSTRAGSLTLQADGAFVYAPSPNFNGIDTFRYHATDGISSSNVVTVSIEVGPANDAPVAVADAYQTQQGTPLVVAAPGLLANDSDVDHDSLSASIVAPPAGGVLTLGPDGSFVYTANAGTSADSFTYRASDGSLVSATATVSIIVTQPINAAPVAVDDYATTVRNVAVVIDVASNDTDSDGTITRASVTVSSQPTRGGTATALGDGTVRFSPRLNFRGTDTFTYTVRDDDGATSAPATVRVDVVRP